MLPRNAYARTAPRPRVLERAAFARSGVFVCPGERSSPLHASCHVERGRRSESKHPYAAGPTELLEGVFNDQPWLSISSRHILGAADALAPH